MNSSRCTDNIAFVDPNPILFDNSSLSDHTYTIKPNTHKSVTHCETFDVKVMSVNRCSLRSIARRATLGGLLEEHKPDIIVGCESHLDDSYLSSEIFPAGFNVYRKDRIAGGGGVFLGIKDTLVAVEEPTITTAAEIIWAKISLYNLPSLYICSYYRPPQSDLQPILELGESIDMVKRKNPNCDIIVAGDFNFPSIEWNDGQGTILPNPTYGHNLNEVFLDTIDNHNLEQFVNSPTRQSNVLDLVFTSTPSLIREPHTAPGMSDHEIVIFFINRKRPAINKKTLRRVYLYHRGDISSLQNELRQFQEHFSASDPLQNSTEHNWQLLKDAMQKAISKHIPSKPARSRDKLPWITPLIKQKMKLRKCLYDKAKRTNTYTHWCDYKKVRNEVNSLLETAHHNYCANLFNDSSSSKKRFWSYIKSKRKDNNGVAPLKNGDTVCTDAKHKACVLNKQFQSVFTAEDLSSYNSNTDHCLL